MIKNIAFSIALLAMLATNATGDELSVNGGFETGDTSDWVSFPTPTSTFVTTSDAFSGSFAGEVVNTDAASSAVIKQANLGVGNVIAGEEVTISFAAKGATANGGVVFAEFFSELDGGGVSQNLILGSGPLALTSDFQTFNFAPITGSDVSGGITLQFAVVTGGDAGSTAQLIVDDVSISVVRSVPEPGTVTVLGLMAFGMVLRRRR